MKIIKLVLVGYARLSLRQIDRIEYTPKEKTQIILGSNGSGKSSLMKELSPLPAVPAEYRKGGSKEIWIEHRGKEYYLLCSFPAEGSIFEFHCDGVNLNPGRTVTVFKELVKEHFNYTPDLHALVTGRVLFHELSVNDRRKLFMSMNKTDFTYAFGYFNKLKERARDLQGTITQLQKRLSSEIDGLLTPEQEIAVKRDAEEMRGILESLLMAKRMTSEDPRQIEREYDATNRQRAAIYNELQDALRRYEGSGSRRSLSSLETLYSKQVQKLTEAKKELNIRYEQHLKLENELREVQAADSVDIGQLSTEIAELTEERAAAEQLLEVNVPWSITTETKASQLLDMLNATADVLQHYADELVQYKDREEILTINAATYQTLKGDLSQHTDLLNRERHMLSGAKMERDRMDRSKTEAQVVCPKCTHAWHLGYTDSSYKAKLAEIELVEKQIHNREQVINKLNEQITATEHFLTIRKAIGSLYQSYSDLSGFWNYLANEQFFSRYPERISHELNRLRVYLTSMSKIDHCAKQLTEKMRLKGFYEAARNKNKGKIEESFRELEKTIESVHAQVKSLTESSNLLAEEIAVLKEIDILYTQFTVTTLELKRTGKDVVSSYLDGVLGDFINGLKTEIVQKERAVAQVSMKKAVIENTEASIQTYKDELKLVNMAIDALSPKTGLIAQGMSLFINTFIERVNNFIAKVWSYPLTLDLLRPENDEEIDLDYKFSVNVNNTGASPDIASTSSGMREIIHLACVITCMRFMGFDYHPVFLDEFAVKMDDAHRKAAYNIIEYLIDEDNVSQVFLISHYEKGYSSLSAADITVLCDANVAMPKHLTYNSCTLIS